MGSLSNAGAWSNGHFDSSYWPRTPAFRQDLCDDLVEMDFITRHYLLNYLWSVAENVCLEFAEKLETYPEMQSWNDFYIQEEFALKLRNPKEWEMEHWSIFLNGIPDKVLDNATLWAKSSILSSLGVLRLSAVHRYPISNSDLYFAMKLPELLGDWQRAFEVEQVFMVSTNNPAMEEETRKRIGDTLFSPRVSTDSAIAVGGQIVKVLEASCFRRAKLENPWLVFLKGWTCAEKSEMQDYREHWCPGGLHPLDVYPSPILEDCEDLDGQLFSQGQLRAIVFRNARALRDVVAHRNSLGDQRLREYAESAILTALLVNDQEAAMEIEIVAEQWLTRRSCYQVLARLQEYYKAHGPVNSRDCKRAKTLRKLIGIDDKEVYYVENICVSTPGIDADCPSFSTSEGVHTEQQDPDVEDQVRNANGPETPSSEDPSDDSMASFWLDAPLFNGDALDLTASENVHLQSSTAFHALRETGQYWLVPEAKNPSEPPKRRKKTKGMQM